MESIEEKLELGYPNVGNSCFASVIFLLLSAITLTKHAILSDIFDVGTFEHLLSAVMSRTPDLKKNIKALLSLKWMKDEKTHKDPVLFLDDLLKNHPAAAIAWRMSTGVETTTTITCTNQECVESSNVKSPEVMLSIPIKSRERSLQALIEMELELLEQERVAGRCNKCPATHRTLKKM